VPARAAAGVDTLGAYYWIAVPSPWNGVLVLHAHGGPELDAPSSERTARDLALVVWLRADTHGGLVVPSGRRRSARGGRRHRTTAPHLRRRFRRTAAHDPARAVVGSCAVGAGSVQRDDASGRPPYDAVLLTSGVLGGGTRAYDFRLDLRVVYEAVRQPSRADEPQHPLQGSARAQAHRGVALARRVDSAPGSRHPLRSAAPDNARPKTLLDVIHIPSARRPHLQWGTFHFQDIVSRLGGATRSPTKAWLRWLGRRRCAERASSAIAPTRRRSPFAADTDPTEIPVPILTLHAIDDPTAFSSRPASRDRHRAGVI
jgi:hypothetical protein